MLRHNPHDGHGVGPDGIRPFHMKFHGLLICGHCLFEHGKIVDRTAFLHRIIGKRHILCRQRLPVRKGRILPDRDGPGHAVLTGLHIRCQIIIYGKVRLRHRERTLDQRLMYMLSRSPAIRRVKSGLRFRVDSHDHDHGVLRRTFSILCRKLCSGFVSFRRNRRLCCLSSTPGCK